MRATPISRSTQVLVVSIAARSLRLIEGALMLVFGHLRYLKQLGTDLELLGFGRLRVDAQTRLVLVIDVKRHHATWEGGEIFDFGDRQNRTIFLSRQDLFGPGPLTIANKKNMAGPDGAHSTVPFHHDFPALNFF